MTTTKELLDYKNSVNPNEFIELANISIYNQNDIEGIRCAVTMWHYNSTFIRETNGMLLYRGIDKNKFSSNDILKVFAHRKDRKPMNTAQSVHDIINKFFIDNYGIPFRNGIFATCHKSVAIAYGTAVAIYPSKDYKYIWSPELRDMYVSFPARRIIADIFMYDTDMVKDLLRNKKLVKFIKDLRLLSSSEIRTLIKTGNLPSNDRLYNANAIAANILKYMINEIPELSKLIYDEIAKFKWRTSDITQACNKMSEISIWTDEYVALSTTIAESAGYTKTINWLLQNEN